MSMKPFSSPSGPIANDPEVERRSVHRYVSDRLPTIQVLVRPGFQRLYAIVRDVSATGVGLVCDRFLEPGSLLAVLLQRKHAGISGILTARVIHSKPLSSGRWLCGCRLSKNLTDDEIFALL